MTQYREKVTWTVHTWNGSSWDADGTIPSPGMTEIDEPLKSTTDIVILADGSEAKITPETKYRLESMTMSFSRFDITTAVKNKLFNYAKNNTGLKLTPGLTGPYTYYEGYIDTASTRWLLESGRDNIRLQTQINFKLFDIDADGVIISGTDMAL